MKRILGRILIGLIAALSVTYVGDWAIWRARVAMGGGMGTVSVGTLIETPLKGNKMEYDWVGTADVDCSKSLFPQAGSGACWWLVRHPVVYEQ
jgi:xanthine dehydrogenase iron-sulfur cluster and FAD-binding subunit A